MRKFAKISAVLAAMVLALAFVGCKDDDDDPSVVTTWYCTEKDEDGSSATMTLYFYDDNTFKMIFSEGSITATGSTGTYTGDTTKDGKIKLTATKIMDDDGNLVDCNETTEGIISGNKMTIEEEGEGEGETVTTIFIKK